jgi:DNA-binding MarR family transcriptional regulator
MATEDMGGEPSLVRPYSLTSGRTRPTIELALEALIQALPDTGDLIELSNIEAAIVELSQQSPSVAEIAARLSVPIGVARVLVADLVDNGYVQVLATLQDDSSDAERRELIERVLSGLRKI